MLAGKNGNRLKIKEVEVTVKSPNIVMLKIDCPKCLWEDVDNPRPLRAIDQDMDELNYVGSVDLKCDHCGSVFTVFMELEYVEEEE